MKKKPPRPNRRRRRRADALLGEAARALHDLPDHQCPTDLLERIRLHLAAGQPAPQPGEPSE